MVLILLKKYCNCIIPNKVFILWVVRKMHNEVVKKCSSSFSSFAFWSRNKRKIIRSNAMRNTKCYDFYWSRIDARRFGLEWFCN